MHSRLLLRLLLLLLAGAIPSVTRGAGFAFSDNFLVLAPDRPLAYAVLAQAEAFRKQVAREWLGEELPPGEGKASIHVKLSPSHDDGFTWATDGPDRRLHKVWLTTTREGATGATLLHEVVHLVFATRFAGRLPIWVEEGVASLTDSQERIRTRRRILQQCAQTGNWPDVARLFQLPTIPANQQSAYTVAASLTEYLLSRGDRSKLLRFALSGRQGGWDQALRQHYGLAGVGELQSAWQAWASQPSRLYARRAAPDSESLAATTGQRR
jgi:hypothetical protein